MRKSGAKAESVDIVVVGMAKDVMEMDDVCFYKSGGWRLADRT